MEIICGWWLLSKYCIIIISIIISITHVSRYLESAQQMYNTKLYIEYVWGRNDLTRAQVTVTILSLACYKIESKINVEYKSVSMFCRRVAQHREARKVGWISRGTSGTCVSTLHNGEFICFRSPCPFMYVHVQFRLHLTKFQTIYIIYI